jgi:hypothetical protein
MFAIKQFIRLMRLDKPIGIFYYYGQPCGHFL